MISPIYLDYAATTPVAKEVAEAMTAALTHDGNFGNPASRSHIFGWRAEEAVENARAELASFIAADPREIVWTSGATESTNLALKGLVNLEELRDSHFITSQIEHKSVLDTFGFLESLGAQVDYIAPRKTGEVAVEDVLEHVNNKTRLISLMHANNETGVINDVASLGKACREQGLMFHVDAAQTLGKIPVNVREIQADFVSFSAHKLYGPKGCGALFVRRSPDVKIKAQIHGGGHERAMRSGTLATHQVVGFGTAVAIAKPLLNSEFNRVTELRKQFLQGLADLPGIIVNGTAENILPGIVNIAFEDVDGETLLTSLQGLAISTGSACTSATIEPSYVLRAMGLSSELAHGSLRFSFGRYTSESDIQYAVDQIRQVISALAPKDRANF